MLPAINDRGKFYVNQVLQEIFNLLRCGPLIYMKNGETTNLLAVDTFFTNWANTTMPLSE